MSYQINPSILSANFAHLGKDVKEILKSGADRIHFDVMDNHYVPNLSFGPMVLESLRKDGINAKIDVHLMVDPVDSLINRFAEVGASSISFHPEASKDVDKSLSLIRSYGIESGLVLNPATPITLCEYVINQIDRLLIMTVNPGFSGQKFISHMYNKIKKISEWIKIHNKKILIEVDGGIKIDNISKIASCGAKAFVLGSALFDNSNNYKNVIDTIRKKLLFIK